MPNWTVDIAGTQYAWNKIHFIKEHPTPNPDTFDIVMRGRVTTIDYFDYVVIRRNGVIKFFGYVEKIIDSTEEGGNNTTISGRNRKVLLWKKYMERFVDTRLDGFFKCLPHELFAFLLRCPVSDVPIYDTGGDWALDYPRHKIGWGIASDNWTCQAYDNAGATIRASGTDPSYPRLRLSGFYWRNRGSTPIIATFLPDGVEDINGWNEFGAVNENTINTDDIDATYIEESVIGETSWKYTMQNLGGTATTVNNVKIRFKVRKTGGWIWENWGVALRVYYTVGGVEVSAATSFFNNNMSYEEREWDVSSFINTVAIFNSMKIRFELLLSGGVGSNCRITYAYANVDYVTGGSQEVNDRFIVDLSESKTRVCGIIVQSRASVDQYARHYVIETSTDGVVWVQRATSNVAGNTAQDIIHSWNPVTARYIRARITTQTLGYSWEITQIYVYQADTADYTVLESTVSPSIAMERWSDCEPAMVLRLPLDEGVGTIAHDLTVNHNNGTIFGATWITGKFGKALYFDGSSDRITVNDDVSLDFGTNSFSIVMWEKIGGVDYNALIGKLADTSHAGFVFYTDGGSYSIYLRGFVQTTNLDRVLATWDDVPAFDNTWKHLVIVVDRTSQKIKVYVNSVKSSIEPDLSTQNVDNSANLLIGNNCFNNDLYGIIDEVRIYNRALSAEEILNLYNASPHIDESMPSIQPINMPYQRLTDGLEQLVSAIFNATYIPYEWWIEDGDFGQIHMASRRGSDKSAVVKFLDGQHVDTSTYERSINQTAQRVRVVGKSEGRRQDECTSNWQTDGASIALIHTFYEELLSEKEISYSITANEWAKAWLKKLRNMGELIKIKVTSDPYSPPNESYDVGDDVTIRDNKTGILEASRRIRELDVTVSEEGETVQITATNSWRDLTDRISQIYKELKKLEFSGTGVEEWTAEGSNQNKVNQEQMDNYWSMQKKYNEANELVKAATLETYHSHPASRSDVNIGQMLLEENGMIFRGPSANTGGFVYPEIYMGDPTTGNMTRMTAWDRNPRFNCNVIINGAFRTINDVIFLGMDSRGSALINRFGFYILWDGASYTLRAFLADNGSAGGYYTRDLGTITTGILYELSAEVDWDDKMIFYSFGIPDSANILQGCIPFSAEMTNMNLTPLWIYGELDGDGVGQAGLEFFLWKSQGKKESVP